MSTASWSSTLLLLLLAAASPSQAQVPFAPNRWSGAPGGTFNGTYLGSSVVFCGPSGCRILCAQTFTYQGVTLTLPNVDPSDDLTPDAITGNATPSSVTDTSWIPYPLDANVFPTNASSAPTLNIQFTVGKDVPPGRYYIWLSISSSGCQYTDGGTGYVFFGYLNLTGPSLSASISGASPAVIPTGSYVQSGRLLTRDDLTVTVTDETGTPASRVMIQLQSDRPLVDVITQPAAPTDASGITAATVETRNQTSPSTSTISSATAAIATATPAVVQWLPAHYQSPFELTCYVISDEADYLKTALIDHVPGLPRGEKLHKGFIHDVELQGSGQALNGSVIQYNPLEQLFYTSSCPYTASHDCAVDGTSAAVDPKVVPRSKTSTLSISGIGSRIADDTGGGINGYHVDLYFGTRRHDCVNFGRQYGASVDYVNY